MAAYRVDDEPLTPGWRRSHAHLGDDALHRAELACDRIGDLGLSAQLAAALAALARAHYMAAAIDSTLRPAPEFPGAVDGD